MFQTAANQRHPRLSATEIVTLLVFESVARYIDDHYLYQII